MWRAFDAGEIAEDFARIADLALDAVRIFLRWDDFQPAPDVVDPVMLARLETVTGLAAAAGLRVLPTLFCGHWNGVNYLPGWALEKHRSAGRFPTVSGADASPWGAASPSLEPRANGFAGIRRSSPGTSATPSPTSGNRPAAESRPASIHLSRSPNSRSPNGAGV